jgi:hypothetical protein
MTKELNLPSIGLITGKQLHIFEEAVNSRGGTINYIDSKEDF